MIQVETIQDVRAFETLREEWAELLSSSASDCLFLTWEWQFTWWRFLAGRQTLSILAARSNGTLMGLAPLTLWPASIWRMRPLKTVAFLGTGSVGSDYLDVILRRGHEAEVLAALTEHFEYRNEVIALAQMNTTQAKAWTLRAHLAARGWGATAARTSLCPYLDLHNLSWEGYLEGRSPSVRYNFRRRLRHLERLGTLTLDCATTDDQRRVWLGGLVDLHLKRWEPRGGSDAFHRHDLLKFHGAFTELALARGWLRLFALRAGDTRVAYLYCLRYRESMLFYQSGFDQRYAKLSVGLVAMGLAIQRAIEEGAQEYDLLHGDEAYKFQWATDTREIGRLELYPAHLAGAWCRRTTDLARTVRSAARRLRSGSPLLLPKPISHAASVTQVKHRLRA